MLGPLLLRCALAHVRADRALSSALQRSRHVLQGLLSEALSPAEHAALTRRIYAQREVYGPPGLWPWERAWFERDLPPPPAKLLVGGCGSGRELRALAQQGYRVDGFEPVPSLLASARRALGDRARLFRLGYEELAGDGVNALAEEAPYAAVILGWGSFSHVLERRRRELALAALSRLCPDGPLLLSYHAERPTDAAVRASRSASWGQRLGRGVRRLRRLAPNGEPPEAFLPHAGFIHTFSEPELCALARAVSRELRWGDQPRAYGHASLVPAHMSR